jgi:hypothetical protein
MRRMIGSEYRTLRGEGMTFAELAVVYGATRQNVEKIVSRQP